MNVIVGPAALLALALPGGAVQLASVRGSALEMERRIEAARGLARRSPRPGAAGDRAALLMSDHPMSLAVGPRAPGAWCSR